MCEHGVHDATGQLVGSSSDQGLQPSLVEVVPGVWAWIQPDGTWWVNNAGAIAGDEGTVVFDTCATDVRTRAFLTAVREATGDAPMRYAVNSHQHGDHTYGNSLLPASTVLIGHDAMREGLLADPIIDGCPPAWSPLPLWGDVVRRVPDLTFTTSLTLHTGPGRRVELHHPGYTAHTPGDVVGWLPAEGVLFTGDLLFHGLTPMLFMGSLDGALRVLDWLDGFGAEHVVPGHGPLVAGADLPGVLAAHERYYRFVRELVDGCVRDGVAPLDAARAADLGEFAAWPDAERLVLNVHRACAEAAGTDVDLGRALGDTLAYNGGPLHTKV